ncbi:peptidyl-tRNA hydrolase ICT1, mitochondrial [Orussus abietinus]|uniref:peptidyl-tRNA hydrolase ICT1, mitochondrial n=1 Tax=Orussus abietinus TaxID=222816 RepID=UPI0006266937|nr:peptidyl-tRNA hydrolase ICT1, mitochondrial [Orussus abietinus]
MNFVGRQFLRAVIKETRSQCFTTCPRQMFSYKSAFALERLYPNSNLSLYTPTFVPEDPTAKFNGYIPLDQLTITYSRSGGPGGQNVNRVNTKVDLRFNVKEAKWLPEDIKDKLIEQNKTKISKEGCLIIRSELTRSQQLNLADALEKLRSLVRKALEPPPEVSPETEERKWKNQIKAARHRLFEKRVRSDIKQHRQAPSITDF